MEARAAWNPLTASPGTIGLPMRKDETDLPTFFVCPLDHGALVREGTSLVCASAGHRHPIVRGMPRFFGADTHGSFALQWSTFWDVQLDSRNGTNLSRERLLAQSRLRPGDFAGRTVLEVGCGAGRFTEVLLSFGAYVIAIDASGAVDACAESNADAIRQNRLRLAQADVFALPLPARAFDMVIGYGMLQHTGNPARALGCLWERVRPGGLLLVDRYQLDLRHVLPFKYATRPFLKRVKPESLLAAVERLCRILVPFERAVLRRVQGGGPGRFARYVLGRFPNSTFPLNLEVQGRLTHELAFRWSVLDTFDQYSPRYDLPCTADAWRTQLRLLPEGTVEFVGSMGQGNVGVVRRG